MRGANWAILLKSDKVLAGALVQPQLQKGLFSKGELLPSECSAVVSCRGVWEQNTER